MNLRVSDFAKTGKPCVYRYIDKKDGIVKYVGIVYKQSLQKRIQDHLYNDEWCKNGNWKIEYFECETKSEVEAFEAHLIALYKTEKYFNKVELTGYICKKGKARETKSGRKVIDFIVAINRLFRKSDYLPVLAWNKDVNYINNINISSEVSIVGRFQSRAYYKKDCDGNLIEKVAYEISSSKILSKKNSIDELILG